MALASRVSSLQRALERLRALESYPSQQAQEEERNERRDTEAVLRQALEALSNPQCYEAARRLVAGEPVSAAGGLGSYLALQRLSQAGLATWDVGSGATQCTPLLRGLLELLEQVIEEASAITAEGQR